MPDQALFDAAAKGELSDKKQIEAQARRLLKDPKASRLLEYFDQWLDTDRLSALDRDANVYAGIPSNLPELLQNETHAFVSYLLQSPAGNLSELLTAQYSFLNADLAKHYGVTGPTGPAYQRVDMPGRAGVLTQGMLLAHDKPTRTSIVRRGLKVRLDLLCERVPFQKISVLAFACDLTRSINFNWSGNTSNRVYRNLGFEAGHHDISHDSSDEAFAKIRAIHKHLWTMSTSLYESLKGVPEAGGTLWDNTLVVHWNELGQGDAHSENDALVVLAGGAANHFSRGRYLDFQNQVTFADMLVSCFHYMGYNDVLKFGDDRLNSAAPLLGLTA